MLGDLHDIFRARFFKKLGPALGIKFLAGKRDGVIGPVFRLRAVGRTILPADERLRSPVHENAELGVAELLRHLVMLERSPTWLKGTLGRGLLRGARRRDGQTSKPNPQHEIPESFAKHRECSFVIAIIF